MFIIKVGVFINDKIKVFKNKFPEICLSLKKNISSMYEDKIINDRNIVKKINKDKENSFIK
jgi:hypothetical protein